MLAAWQIPGRCVPIEYTPNPQNSKTLQIRVVRKRPQGVLARGPCEQLPPKTPGVRHPLRAHRML
jgi:hypothetical protein